MKLIFVFLICLIFYGDFVNAAGVPDVQGKRAAVGTNVPMNDVRKERDYLIPCWNDDDCPGWMKCGCKNTNVCC